MGSLPFAEVVAVLDRLNIHPAHEEVCLSSVDAGDTIFASGGTLVSSPSRLAPPNINNSKPSQIPDQQFTVAYDPPFCMTIVINI